MQAIILAAGMGKRLGELTRENTKCMVRVNGITLIERMLDQLERSRLKRIIIVIGFEGEKLKEFVSGLNLSTPIEFVVNEVYYKTNNIYSLFLAREKLREDDTILLESDLIFEDSVLDKVINARHHSVALVAKFESWMDGTVVNIDGNDNIVRFIDRKQFRFEEIPSYYKTVNIYRFSKEFSTTHYIPFLEAYCKALGHSEYYEQVLRVIILLDKPEIKALRLGREHWYEIDDILDLDNAETVFADGEERTKRIQNRYGGYWRYPYLADYCYLVNPYFPTPKLKAEIKANLERLMDNYPSGMHVNSLLAARYFNVRREYISIGNGAAELIKSIVGHLRGKMGVCYPSFEEYSNRKPKEELVEFIPGNSDYSYTADDLYGFFHDKEISTLLLINPDNPSGNFIPVNGLMHLLEWTRKKGITLIVDESFVDFADNGESNSLLTNEIISGHPNLIVIRSISKSYGVPGLRLGILASGNTEIISFVKKDVAIWNINSIAEFYLQIFGKYESDYTAACKTFIAERSRFYGNLLKIPFLRVIPSQANYFLCEVRPPFDSVSLTRQLLEEKDILIKDCSTKKGFNGKSYVRIAVRDEEMNDRLCTALQELQR
ncbi:MAG: aminotransferase class I/II-fold pyridoxal phosphate-dependent enzyme [Bacteroidales bacterium]|nr:aminotransferase class I/II-fold pyridoxal phosphate-dependent enzyme [Bacteroidales bacterium]